MKYAKMLGLLLIAAAALMAFAGTASAKLTSASGTEIAAGTVIKAQSEGATSLGGTIKLTCQKSTIEETVSAKGGTSSTVTSLTFTECGANTVSVSTGGTAAVESSGTSKSTNAEVTALTHNILGTVHCIYKTNSTDVGTLTDSSTTGSTARWDIGSAGIPQVATDFGCKDDAVWTGNYKVTTPDFLDVD
jgi:hypothetical protein